MVRGPAKDRKPDGAVTAQNRTGESVVCAAAGTQNANMAAKIKRQFTVTENLSGQREMLRMTIGSQSGTRGDDKAFEVFSSPHQQERVSPMK